ncbi:MAG: efflux RND transporter permease subunit [Rhodopseudomonas palustris]|nr:efflux RND transporter permease subunit [Rhodopseudomonas palustris]
MSQERHPDRGVRQQAPAAGARQARRPCGRPPCTRLRPILMTTAAMVTGLIPLLTASGAGAASRFSIGLVVVAGMSIGTLFTLFVLPAVYVAIGTDHRADAESKRNREIADFEVGTTPLKAS